jgi:hypothetical protein
MGKKTQLGPIDPIALQFRYGALELFRIIEDATASRKVGCSMVLSINRRNAGE